MRSPVGVPVEHLAARRPEWFDATVDRHGGSPAGPGIRADVDFAHTAVQREVGRRTGHRVRSSPPQPLIRRRRTPPPDRRVDRRKSSACVDSAPHGDARSRSGRPATTNRRARDRRRASAAAAHRCRPPPRPTLRSCCHSATNTPPASPVGIPHAHLAPPVFRDSTAAARGEIVDPDVAVASDQHAAAVGRQPRVLDAHRRERRRSSQPGVPSRFTQRSDRLARSWRRGRRASCGSTPRSATPPAEMPIGRCTFCAIGTAAAESSPGGRRRTGWPSERSVTAYTTYPSDTYWASLPPATMTLRVAGGQRLHGHVSVSNGARAVASTTLNSTASPPGSNCGRQSCSSLIGGHDQFWRAAIGRDAHDAADVPEQNRVVSRPAGTVGNLPVSKTRQMERTRW